MDGKGSLPFSGVRIVDFSWWGVGPMIARHLADYGAEIIKVETGTHLDPIRLNMGIKDNVVGINRGGWWASLNHGRMGITLNLKRPEAVELAKRLVARADIVNENFTTGKIAEFGLGYDELVKIKPDVILMSTNIFGQTGPARKQPGHGGTGQAMALFAHFTGWPEKPEPPGTVGTAGSDFTSPQLGAAVLIAALARRRRTGKGCHIDLSQLEATMPYFGPAILDYTVNRSEGERRGNRSEFAAPHGIFRCAGDDRWIAISICSDDQWRALRRVMGEPVWASAREIETLAGRLARQDDIEAAIERWTLGHDPLVLARELQAAGVPAGPVENAADLMNDPQLNHREHFVYLDHPEIGRQGYEQRSYRLSRTPGWPSMPGPTLGQHNDYVFRELLGLSPGEIERLQTQGAIA